MRKFFLALLFVLLYTCFTFTLHAAHYYYKQIALEEGLSSTVYCTLVDEQGFVWIGTQSGLGRFDGHELKSYVHKPDDPNSLPDNLIHKIVEDKQHNIWVLTERGLACYQRQSDSFTVPTDEHGKRIVAFSFCHSADGILFGSYNRIYHYCYKDSSIRLIQQYGGNSSFRMMAIDFWDSQTLLCCNRWQGLLLLDMATGESRLPPFKCDSEVIAMITDSQNRLWVAFFNKGLKCFSRTGELLASYTTHNSSLNNNIILSMAEREGHLWLGTDGGGINILNLQTGQLTLLEYIPGEDNYSLPANSILSLYNDKNNNIWAGSIRNGLISIREVYMKTYMNVIPGNNNGLSDKSILSLYQQTPDRIWIGTDGGGINSFNPYTEKITHYPSTWKDKVVSISGYTSGKLLISVYAQGVFVFDPKTGVKSPFTIIDRATTVRLCNQGKIINLYQNTPNTVLLFRDQIYQYHIKENRFDTIAEEKHSEPLGATMAIAQTDSKTYLNNLKYIYEFDHLTGKLTTLFKSRGDTIINSVAQDEYGNFWIGNNYGLNYYSVIKKTQTRISTALFAGVSQLVYDRQGKLWIGANNMLFTWLVNEKKFILWGESDGALPNEYLSTSRLVSEQGDIYMGGVKGLLHINSKLPLTTSELSFVQLSDIVVNGESVHNKLVGRLVGISVPWNSNIRISIMAREKVIFRKKLYRYQIQGLSNKYIESYNPELTLHSLPPGNYNILASCINKDGSWISDSQVLSLTVLSPWYRTWWFISCCSFFLLGGVLIIFRIILKHKREKLKWAMKEHEKQVYEDKVHFLINISHELRTPLTLIHTPLNQILKSLSSSDTYYLPLKAIYRQSQRMKDLINMVLEVRKMEVRESRLQLQVYLLNEWIKEISQDFDSEANAKNVYIRYQLDPRVNEVCYDKSKCEIVFNNLMINALKHSPHDSEIAIVSELLPETDRVRISIVDRGCGLQHVDVSKLFTRFYQGTGEQTGTGIGLSYSKILVELHGGSIGARNNSEVGAAFFFELPLKQNAKEIARLPQAYLNELMLNDSSCSFPDSDNFDTSPYVALVVDDNQELTSFLAKSLKSYFKRIYVAADGKEALLLARNHSPDIIISDVMMPRMNGYELCKNIKEDITISHISIILLTARDDKQSLLSGYKNGADGYITKPFEIDILIALIRNRLKNRKYYKQKYMNLGFIPTPQESTFSQADETLLLKLNKIIMDNLDSPQLTTSFLCLEVGMSRTSLYNKLKALTDMGSNDYINKIRMEKAISLMASTDMSITEIAGAVGFSNSRYFSTAFKQYTQETPTEYKQAMMRKRKES
ncbi:MAG: two-component regulator propeller domain-containing protein [Bacteroides xylanisolvens]